MYIVSMGELVFFWDLETNLVLIRCPTRQLFCALSVYMSGCFRPEAITAKIIVTNRQVVFEMYLNLRSL